MRRVLLDTHALLWWRADDPSLSEPARATIADPATEALVSVASIWEIAIKRSIGKLRAPATLTDSIVEQGFGWLGIAPEHASAVADLPRHHSDPFDRLLVAQAIAEGIPVITGDPSIRRYEVEVIW